MTRPTIEKMVEWLHPFCKLDEQPSQSDLVAANMASAIIAALTAQAGDGNRLPLEEVPEGWVVFSIGNDDPDGVDFSWYVLLREKAVPGMSSADSGDRRTVGADGATPAEALRAAFAAAKDGAG